MVKRLKTSDKDQLKELGMFSLQERLLRVFEELSSVTYKEQERFL